MVNRLEFLLFLCDSAVRPSSCAWSPPPSAVLVTRLRACSCKTNTIIYEIVNGPLKSGSRWRTRKITPPIHESIDPFREIGGETAFAEWNCRSGNGRPSLISDVKFSNTAFIAACNNRGNSKNGMRRGRGRPIRGGDKNCKLLQITNVFLVSCFRDGRENKTAPRSIYSLVFLRWTVTW